MIITITTVSHSRNSENTIHMSKRNIVFLFVADQGYIRNIKRKVDFAAQNDILFSAVSDTYIPLLNMLSQLESESIPVKMGVVLSPALCTLLDDPQVQNQFIDWVDRRIALGKAEVVRCQKNKELLAQAQTCLDKAQKDKIDFTEVYGQKLLEKFRYFASKDMIALIPTAAAYAFLPQYADLTEVLNAQVETGLYAHRHFFGDAGEGFWLPYMGWAKGLDKVLRSYGVNYTILENHGLLFAENPPETGIFAPVRSNNSLALFGRDYDSSEEAAEPDRFCKNSIYRLQQRDIGFDLEKEALAPFAGKSKVRVQTGYKYYANGDGDEEDEIAAGDAPLYDRHAALEQVKKDALEFYTAKAEKLAKASELLHGQDVSVVCAVHADLLGQTWFEGIDWLEQLFRIAAEKKDAEFTLCRDLLQNQFTLQKVEPYPSAASGTGYGEDLLDSSNGWMLRYTRKACERIIDLTDRFPSDTGLKARLLNLGAKELLLAQSGEWPKMIHEGRIPDYVNDMFRKNIISFTTVFDSLGSNTVSTEWLTEIEKEHDIFPWMNYRVFSRKK